MKKNKFTILVFLCISILITSCDGNNKNTKSSQVSKSEITQTEPILLSEKVYLLEDLNDPEFYKHERLQFVWQPKGENFDSVWTIKLDGSDLRRVIEPKKMLYNGATRLNSVIKRSPNRRYLAYANDGDGRQVVDKNIIDLKTGEIIKLGTDSSGSVFFWSPDGNLLFFLKLFKFHKYNLETKKTTTLDKRFRVGGLVALPDGKTVVGYSESGVAYYDYNGKYIKSIKLEGMDKLLGGGRSISSTGSNLLQTHISKYRLYNLTGKSGFLKSHDIPSAIISNIMVMHNNVNDVFMELSSNYSNHRGVMRYELKTDTFYNIFEGDRNTIENFSILY